MAIVTNLDVMMAKRKIKLKDLASRIGISETNLSLLKTGKVQGLRYKTLNAICSELDCQPGDLLEFRADDINSGREQKRPRPTP